MHGLGAGACAIALAFVPGLGLLYVVPALGITAVLWWAGIALVIEPTRRRAYRLFHASNFYLLIILVAVVVGTLVKLP